jgi:acyl-CoA synthetase (AMP-forming)/AMP-acid ligase II
LLEPNLGLTIGTFDVAAITVITDEVQQRIITELTAPGAPYEVSTAVIGGVEYPVFKSPPQNLTEVYAQGIDQDSFIPKMFTGWFGEQDYEFIVYGEERYTFSETYRIAAGLAWRLQEQYGLAKGDRVAIAMRNYPEFCFAFMAITALGAVAVPLNAWWEGPELKYGLENSEPSLVFADEQRVARMAPFLEELKIPAVVVRASGTIPESCVAYGDLDVDETKTEFPDVEIDIDDDAYILYTSGTTGYPKGVVSTHRALVNTLTSWELATFGLFYLNRDCLDEVKMPNMMAGVLTVPLFHLTGLVSQFLGSFRQKRKMVILNRWDADEALCQIEKEKLTSFIGVPSMSWELVNSPHFPEHDTSSLTVLSGGGTARPKQHVLDMEERLGRHIAVIGYGMTETTALGAVNRGESYMSKPDSVGPATPPLMEIKIIDEDGNTLETGELGEICFRSPTNLRCYWRDPAATEAISLGDGWIRSGDLGELDAEGFVYIRDRIKDLIIRGGENIACTEVEDALYQHPDVAEATVFGLPEEKLGEQVAAVIMTREGAELNLETLQEFLSSRLAKFKIPVLIYFQTEPLLRGATGKVQKKSIREAKLKELEAE